MKYSAVFIISSVLMCVYIDCVHNAMVEFCDHAYKNPWPKGFCVNKTLTADCTNIEEEYVNSISYVDPFDGCISIYSERNCEGKTVDLYRFSVDRLYLETCDFNDLVTSYKRCYSKPPADIDDPGKDSANQVLIKLQADNNVWQLLDAFKPALTQMHHDNSHNKWTVKISKVEPKDVPNVPGMFKPIYERLIYTI